MSEMMLCVGVGLIGLALLIGVLVMAYCAASLGNMGNMPPPYCPPLPEPPEYRKP